MRDMVQVRRASGQRHKGPEARIGRSQFDRSHGLKTTFDASYLYPIFVDDVLPGDTMTCKLNGFCRIFSPLDAPVMDNIELETFFFFVPNRLIWNNWEAFQGAHDDAGAQDTDYTIPIMEDGITVDHDGGTAGLDLMAYFGIPDGLQTTQVEVSALPMRSYNIIYNEWFRDQNLKDKRTQTIGNGPDTISSYAIFKGNKKHDYFTSALPYLQKGDDVQLLPGGLAPVVGIAKVDQTYNKTGEGGFETDGVDETYPFSTQIGDSGGVQDLFQVEGTAASSGLPMIYANVGTNLTINALREAVAIQRLLEQDARGGTRYVEKIKAHFGVTSPDFRLQRPEFLGGGKSFINISPVANTVGINATDSPTSAAEYQAELRGIGTGVIQGHGWAKSFTEHGYIIGLIRARGDITYFQGLDRHWSRSTPYDFYVPALASLGEQSILNKEIWISNAAADDTVFGYQERWSEYRQKQSKITGLMNPDAASAISHWHLAEDFATLPALNSTFVEDSTPIDRIVTIASQPDFIMDLWFDYRCARPLPVFSVPSLMAAHF